MKITYDKIADAMYIYFNKGKHNKTTKLADRLVVDLDKKGKVIGIEILDVSSQIGSVKPQELKIKVPTFA